MSESADEMMSSKFLNSEDIDISDMLLIIPQPRFFPSRPLSALAICTAFKPCRAACAQPALLFARAVFNKSFAFRARQRKVASKQVSSATRG
jgi:hypothetical protein